VANDIKDLEKTVKLMGEQLEKLTEINEQTKTFEEKTKLINEDYKKTKAELEAIIVKEGIEKKLLEEKKEIIEKRLSVEEKKLKILESQLETQEQILLERVKEAELEFKSGKITEEKYKAAQKINNYHAQNNQKLKEDIKLEREKLDLQKASVEQLGQIDDHTETILSATIGITEQWKGTLLGRISQASKEIGGFSAALGEVGKGIKKTITPANILGSSLIAIYTETKRMVMEQDQAVSQFNKFSGAAGLYDKAIMDLGKNNLELGIDTHEAAQAFSDLKEQYLGFTKLNKAQQGELALLTATMNEFGVSSSITAENIQIMASNMGMNVEQVKLAQREIVSTANALGESPAKLASEFAKAGQKLAVFGKEGGQIFRNLAVQAKNLNIEVSRLLDIAEGFDTFEGAGTAVGKLNAILGGPYLDAMEMIKTTDPTQRIIKLRQAVDSSGRSFEQMGYYEKRALASAAGMSDVAELSKLMSGSLTDMAFAAQEDAASKEKMADMASKANNIMEKLKATMTAFAIGMEPAINIVRALLDGFLSLNKMMRNSLIPALTLGLGAFMAINKVMQIGAGIKTTYLAVTKLLSLAKIKDFIVTTASTIAQKTWNALLAVTIGAKYALLAVTNLLRLSKLRDAAATTASWVASAAALLWTKLFSAAKKKEAIGIAASTTAKKASIPPTVAVGKASAASAVGLLSFAAAAVAVGAAVAGIFYTLSYLVNSFTNFFKLMIDNIAVLPLLAFNLMMLAGAASMLLPSGLGAAYGLGTMAIGVGALALSLALIKTEDLRAISVIFQSITKISDKSVTAIRNIAAAIKEVAASFGELPVYQMVSFGFATASLGSQAPGIEKLVEATVKLKSENVVNVENLVKHSERYEKAREESKGAVFDPIIKLIENTINIKQQSAPVAGNKDSGQRTIILKVGEHQLKKFVLNVLDDKANPRKI